MNDQWRLTYLTRYYYSLQGLRFAPLWIAGLLLIFLWLPHFEQCNCVAPGMVYAVLSAVLLVEAAWFWLASLYYRRTFGSVKPAPLRVATPGAASPFWWIAIMGLLAWAVYCRVHHSAAFFPYFVAFVMAQPVFDPRNPPLRRVEYGLGGILIAGSVSLGMLLLNDGTIYFATLCIVMLALSIADHLLLKSLAKPAAPHA
jgi:hypothetical protein